MTLNIMTLSITTHNMMALLAGIMTISILNTLSIMAVSIATLSIIIFSIETLIGGLML